VLCRRETGRRHFYDFMSTSAFCAVWTTSTVDRPTLTGRVQQAAALL